MSTNDGCDDFHFTCALLASVDIEDAGRFSKGRFLECDLKTPLLTNSFEKLQNIEIQKIGGDLTMRKFIFLVSMGLSTQAFGAIHPYFLDNTIFTKEQQVELIREIETLCPDAADYQWTLAETRTLITSEKADARVKFRTSFLIISAWMREMSVEAELVPSEKLKISSLKGCSW